MQGLFFKSFTTFTERFENIKLVISSHTELRPQTAVPLPLPLPPPLPLPQLPALSFISITSKSFSTTIFLLHMVVRWSHLEHLNSTLLMDPLALNFLTTT